MFAEMLEEQKVKWMHEFTERFGLFGNKLQTEKELEENRKRGGGGTIHFMDELCICVIRIFMR